MTTKRLFSSSLILSAALTVSACGGGESTLNIESAVTEFSAKFTSYLANLTSSAGLNSNTLPNLFDERFLDGGFRKADLVNSLTANASALGTNQELSLFPTATVTNSTLSGCDNNNICTLTGTLTNSDADTTSVDFSTKVIVVSGVVYFYGDQSSTTSL
jgi:hypothetical protein